MAPLRHLSAKLLSDRIGSEWEPWLPRGPMPENRRVRNFRRARAGRTRVPAHKPGGAREITLPIAALGGADFVQHFAAQDVERHEIRRELDAAGIEPEPREQSPGA